MAKLQGRIPSGLVAESEVWSLPVIGFDEDNGSKIFRLKSAFSKNQKGSSPVRSGTKPVCDSGSTAIPPNSDFTTTQSEAAVSVENTENALPVKEASLTGNVFPTDGTLSGDSDLAVEGASSLDDPSSGASSDTERETLDIASKGYLVGEAKGFQAGESAGREQGLREVRAELESAFADEVKDKRMLMSNLLSAFETPPDRQEEIKSSLITLISQVAEVVILSELKANPELIGSLVSHAMDALPHGTTNLKVQVNPVNIEFLRSEMGDLNIEFVPDRNLSIGSCQIQSESSTVDATLAKRIHDSLIKVFSSDAVEEISESSLLDLEGEIEPEC